MCIQETTLSAACRQTAGDGRRARCSQGCTHTPGKAGRKTAAIDHDPSSVGNFLYASSVKVCAHKVTCDTDTDKKNSRNISKHSRVHKGARARTHTRTRTRTSARECVVSIWHANVDTHEYVFCVSSSHAKPSSATGAGGIDSGTGALPGIGAGGMLGAGPGGAEVAAGVSQFMSMDAGDTYPCIRMPHSVQWPGAGLACNICPNCMGSGLGTGFGMSTEGSAPPRSRRLSLRCRRVPGVLSLRICGCIHLWCERVNFLRLCGPAVQRRARCGAALPQPPRSPAAIKARRGNHRCVACRKLLLRFLEVTNNSLCCDGHQQQGRWPLHA